MRWTLLLVGALAALSLALIPVPAPAAAAGDATPPVTTCDAAAGWQRESFVVHFSAEDTESGVAVIWARVDDGSAFQVGGSEGGQLEIPAPDDHSSDGVHTLRYYAVDVAGNAETSQVAEFRIDTAAPSVSVRATAGYAGRAVALRYRVRDHLSGPSGELRLVVSDAGGGVVDEVSLEVASGEWRRARWVPGTAGAFDYTVAATDVAGNAGVSAAAVVDVEALAVLAVGRSMRGRPITVTRFGQGRRRLLIVGGVHGDEAGTPVAKQFVRYLLAHPRALPSGAQIDVLACANPDGYARRTRGNARNVDLNRNLPTRNWRHRLSALNEPSALRLTGGSFPGSEPETQALLAHLRGRFDVVVSLHSRGGILDCSGPGASAVGRRMSALCGLPLGKLWYDPYITGSLGRFVPDRYRIPIVTVELRSWRLGAGMRAALLAAAR